jgi:hypothetical protein
MYDAFVSRGATPNTTPYNVVSPTQDIGQMNTGTSPAAKTSNALPWNHLDAVPQVTSDQILWAAVHGSASPPPPPGPNASPPELELAKLVAGMLREHKDVSRFLLGAGDG